MKEYVMRKYAALFLALCLFACSGKKGTNGTEPTMVTAKISLPTMVCGSCAKTIQKAIYGVEGVKDVDVDLKKKSAVVVFVAERTNIGVIEEAVTDAGYDANNRKRNPDAYEKLDKCCKIDG